MWEVTAGLGVGGHTWFRCGRSQLVSGVGGHIDTAGLGVGGHSWLRCGRSRLV